MGSFASTTSRSPRRILSSLDFGSLMLSRLTHRREDGPIPPAETRVAICPRRIRSSARCIGPEEWLGTWDLLPPELLAVFRSPTLGQDLEGSTMENRLTQKQWQLLNGLSLRVADLERLCRISPTKRNSDLLMKAQLLNKLLGRFSHKPRRTMTSRDVSAFVHPCGNSRLSSRNVLVAVPGHEEEEVKHEPTPAGGVLNHTRTLKDLRFLPVKTERVELFRKSQAKGTKAEFSHVASVSQSRGGVAS